MNLKQAFVYLPQDRRQSLVEGKPLLDRSSGVALFADLSGFTPLAESLLRAFGMRRGAEALLQQLDRLFEALIAQLDGCGGSVISFAGDAITCWFADSGAVPAPHSAITCAIKMQKAMRAFSEIQISGQPPVALALKVTAAYGPARRFVVGDPSIQLIDTLAGSAITRMAAAESEAKRGEILVDETIAAAGEGWPLLEKRLHAESGEYYCVIDQSAPVFASIETTGPRPVEECDDSAAAVIRPYVLPAIWERIEAGMGELMTELRPAAALFLRFTDIDFESKFEGKSMPQASLYPQKAAAFEKAAAFSTEIYPYDQDESAGEKLDTLIRRAQAIMNTYDGNLLQLSIGDKGSYFYASFGAPVAHEDDMLRAVRAAMDLRAAFPQVQIGISQGVMHTGAYGSSTRRTYGVIGDGVNTAARLMSKAAPGEILVNGRVRNATADAIAYEARAPVLLKGKSEPVPVFAASATIARHWLRLEEPSYALPMIGRSAELENISALLNKAADGQGQMIGISGDPGIGKSRLAAEVVREARRRGFNGYGGACQSASASYQVWKTIWQGFFGVDPQAPLLRQVRNLEGEIEDRAPNRVEALPLLGPVLGLALPENDFTAALEPQARKSALEALLIDCLTAEARAAGKDGGGLLFVLEDLHWIDPASLDLLDSIVHQIAGLPVLLVLVYRPLGLRGTLNELSFAAQPNFHSFFLTELSNEDAELVVRAKIAQLYPERLVSSPLALVERIIDRVQGNPFYLEELLNYIHDRGIDMEDPKAIASLELPAELHSLVLSRIDQFTTRQQVTLKAASVIGRLFRYSHLSGYYQGLESVDHPLRDELDVLARYELTPIYGEVPELEYLFKHIITREVTYETLPYTTRAALHEQYARFIEEQESENLAHEAAPLAVLDLLAHHYGLSENTARQVEYFRKAGDAAARAFANAAAVEYYTRLLPLLDETGQQEIRLLLARVHRLTGDFDQCEAILREGLTIAQQGADRVVEGRFRLGLGELSNKRGESEQVLVWELPAQAAFEDHHAGADLIDALIVTAEARCWLAQYPAALADLKKAEAMAFALGDRARLVRATEHTAWVMVVMRNLDQALALYEQAYDLALKQGDRYVIANILNNLGGIAALQPGRQMRALEAYVQGYTAAFEIGARPLMGYTAGNLGELYQEFGAFSEAFTCHAHCLDLSLRIGDRPGVARVLWNLGRLYAAKGTSEAGELLDQSVRLAQSLDIPQDLCEFMQSWAAYLAQSGRVVEAQALNQQAYVMARQVEYETVLFRCQALEPQLKLALGECSLAAATASLRALLEIWNGQEQQADLHYRIWQASRDEASRQQAVDLYRAMHAQSALYLYRARLGELSQVFLLEPELPPPPGMIPPALDARPLFKQARALTSPQ